MKSKHIIAVAMFFTCFAVSSFLVGLFFGKTTTDAELYEIVTVKPQISRDANQKVGALLRQDRQNGAIRNAKVLSYSVEDEQFLALDEKTVIMSEYALDSASIDDSGLPHDFQIVWRKHMNAWDDYSNFLRKAENAEMNSEDIERLESNYDRDINTTWYEVLRVAAKYGAQ